MPLQASIFLLVLRGYYYDTETELYFLKTRYYDPEVGRFISVDGIEYLDPETINGLNLYAYCNNNQILLQNNKLKIKQFTTKNERIKAALLNIFGVKVACVLFKLLHQL